MADAADKQLTINRRHLLFALLAYHFISVAQSSLNSTSMCLLCAYSKWQRDEMCAVNFSVRVCAEVRCSRLCRRMNAVYYMWSCFHVPRIANDPFCCFARTQQKKKRNNHTKCAYTVIPFHSCSVFLSLFTSRAFFFIHSLLYSLLLVNNTIGVHDMD